MIQKKLLITLCIVSCLAMRLKFSLLPMMLSPLFWAVLTDLVHPETKVSLVAELGEKELSKHGWFNPLCLLHFLGTWSWFYPNLTFQGLQVHSQGWGKKMQGGYLRGKSCLFILSRWLVQLIQALAFLLIHISSPLDKRTTCWVIFLFLNTHKYLVSFSPCSYSPATSPYKIWYEKI